jgi:hypothetical protein
VGKPVVFTVRLEGSIVTGRLPLAFAPVLSVTVTDTVNVPAVVGVPDTAPLVETLNPPPAEPDHVYGGVPPAAANCPV